VAASIARIDFDDLCNKPLAASDYIEIALRYKGIILDNIPILNDEMRNETRRFIWLIDALYDKNCFLIASSQTSFIKLYKGKEWEFEFQRTVSRITEMTQL
jgi:cell division protein ZapE